MTRRFFLFDAPDRFTAGTVGDPGQRTFFLQAIQGRRIASVALEKVQVAALADRIGAILVEIERRGAPTAVAAPEAAGDDERPLDEPLREEFRVGTLTISWDSDGSEVVVEARSQVEGEEEEDEDAEEVPDEAPEGPDVLRVRLAPPMARGFAQRAARVVAAGRPPCPFCGQPLNPEGHLCARSNGYVN